MQLRKKFTVEEMKEMEKDLRNSELYTLNLKADNNKLADKLKLKVKYVSDMADDNEAELLPIDDKDYYGLIRIRKKLQTHKYAYTYEIIRYIFDVGYGNRVTKCFTRKKKTRRIQFS